MLLLLYFNSNQDLSTKLSQVIFVPKPNQVVFVSESKAVVFVHNYSHVVALCCHCNHDNKQHTRPYVYVEQITLNIVFYHVA